MPTNRGTEGESPEIRNYCRKCQGIALEVRAAAEGEDSRTIGGYAVKYNTPVLIVDRWGDKYLEEIAAGCFDESLNSCKEAGKEIKALWNHDTSRPLWDWLTERFPVITLFLTEEKYDELLEEALVKFKKMLEDNSSLYDYVYNTVTVSDEDTEDDILRKITEGA
ncbi:hypothetical protein GPK69_03585 [Roseburia inulinivorans]|uniref:HK97 family phage prohead protease n=1 Tax=Roseburia inulinivorans TaxID=360807 RepID=UPI001C0110E8|nr:HK97 family phage prohead protease [Roseburia inulinivorans]MBT9644919.1 hypothetical protein [Roseburia inulinivorans]